MRVGTPQGAFPMEGLSSRCNDVKGRLSGIRTRDSQVLDLMLYPTELSSGGQAGIEPAANGMRHRSTSELLSRHGAPQSLPGMRHGGAARTGQARLPPRTCAALDVSHGASFIGVAIRRERCPVTPLLCANASARRPRLHRASRSIRNMQRRTRTLRIRKIDARPFVGVERANASCMRSNALSATAVRVSSTHGRAASVARWRPDAGCRPGTRCDPARWVRAGTAAARHRAASPAPRSCR